MQDRAVCFEKSNVESLRKNLDELLKDEKKVEQYKKYAQEYVCGKYNWDEIVKDTLHVYG